MVSTLFALVIGLPLGVLLVTGEPGGVRPLPRWVMRLPNGVINLLRSVPFLIDVYKRQPTTTAMRIPARIIRASM